MIGLVLVGGQGTRLRPLTESVPKPMLPIANRPMIERLVERLAAQGIDEVVLSLGYRPQAFQEAFPDDRIAGIPCRYAVEDSPLDTAGAIRFAADAAGIDDTFVVLNGDVITDHRLSDLIGLHEVSGAAATISLQRVDDPSRFGVVVTDEAGRVEGFVEKPAPGTAPSNEISAGTYVLEPEVLAMIPADRPVSIERETFPALVDQGRLYAKVLDGYWLDTGTPAQYVQAHTDMLDGHTAMPADLTEIADGVWVSGEASGLAQVAGPAIVGVGATIAEGATVERASIGPGVSVEVGAAVVGAVVLAGARVGPGARVEGGIVGYDASIGAGAVLTGDTVVASGAEVAPSATHHDDRIAAPNEAEEQH